MPQENPSGLKALVKAESMLQLALVLPAAVLIGLGIGTWLDHVFHRDWIYLAGIGLGAVAGFTQIIRTAMQLNKQA